MKEDAPYGMTDDILSRANLAPVALDDSCNNFQRVAGFDCGEVRVGLKPEEDEDG